MVAHRRDRVTHVVAHDATEPLLGVAWSLGNAIDRTPYHRGITSPEALISWVASLTASGVDVRTIQLWSHGYSSGPVIDGRRFTEDQWRRLGDAAPNLELLWLRACDVGRNPELVFEICSLVRADVAVHCEVISVGRRRFPSWVPLVGDMPLPAPWRQGSLVVLRWLAALGRPEDPWWDPTGQGHRGCKVTDMRIRAYAYNPG